MSENFNKIINEVLTDITLRAKFEFEEKNKKFLYSIYAILDTSLIPSIKNGNIETIKEMTNRLHDLLYILAESSFELGIHTGIKHFLSKLEEIKK